MKKVYLMVLFALLLGGCRVNLLIEGEGTVTSASGNFNCTNNTGVCYKDYTVARSEIFTVQPAPGWTFVKWTGCSYKRLLSCSLSILQQGIGSGTPWPVTATFERINKPVEEATYTYNALGQRKTKTVGGDTTVFLYDLAGNLIAELDETGQALRQHVHINNEPIAQLTTNPANQTIAVQYVHTDHLGTPTLLTNENGTVVADMEATPFGETYVDYAEVTYNKRFPGQYKDGETGLHYNYFRDYDPSLGRYIQSDPIGIEGGLDTYTYVKGNPLIYSDPYGEVPILIPFFGGALLDFGLQMATNGGRRECVKWETVISGGVLAAFSPFGLANVMSKFRKADKFLEKADAARKGSRAQNRYRNKYDKFNKDGAYEYGEYLALEGGNELAGSFVIPGKCSCE